MTETASAASAYRGGRLASSRPVTLVRCAASKEPRSHWQPHDRSGLHPDRSHPHLGGLRCDPRFPARIDRAAGLAGRPVARVAVLAACSSRIWAARSPAPTLQNWVARCIILIAVVIVGWLLAGLLELPGAALGLQPGARPDARLGVRAGPRRGDRGLRGDAGSGRRSSSSEPWWKQSDTDAVGRGDGRRAAQLRRDGPAPSSTTSTEGT